MHIGIFSLTKKDDNVFCLLEKEGKIAILHPALRVQ